MESEKLVEGLHAMFEEICDLRKLYEEVQSSLHTKDLLYNKISSSSEKFQAEYIKRLLKLEGESMELVLSKDEAFARIQDLEKKIDASSEEISCLRRLLSIKQQTNSEMQKCVSMDQKEKDDYILKLEEVSRISQEQLRWKSGQFSHFEATFKVSESEWQMEKLSLDEISSLQGTSDAQLRVSNQAVDNEEIRRKFLNIELSESRSKFENVFLECQAAKSEIDRLTAERDEQIAELRNLFSEKEILANGLKNKIQQLEHENSDKLVPLRNNQEVQFNNNVTSSSLEKLKDEVQCLEQFDGKCVTKLTEKETEWNSQIENSVRDMNYCFSQLAEKNRSIRGLHKKLEDAKSLLGVKNKELLSLMMVLKSEYDVVYSKLYEVEEELEMSLIQNEEKNMILDQQLQLKTAELLDVCAEWERKSNEVAVLVERVELLESLSQKDNLMQEELRRYKSMLDESKQCQSHLQQQILDLENTQADSLKNEVEKVNSKQQNRTSEIETLKIKLQKSESEVETLKLMLKENLQAHEQEKDRLLVAANNKDAKIGDLEKQICLLKSEILAESGAAEMLNQERDHHIRLAEDRDGIIKNLLDEIAQLQNKLAEREVANLALLDANNTLIQENEKLISCMKEKEQKTQELKKELESLDQEFKSAMICNAEKAAMLNEALKAAEGQNLVEAEEKNREISNLEKEMKRLYEEVEFQEKSLVQSKQLALLCEETKESEIRELRCQLEKETRWFEDLLEELQSHKQVLLEDRRKEKIDRENFVAQLEKMCQQIGVFCAQDVELMDMLGKLPVVNEKDHKRAGNIMSSDELSCTSPSRKYVQVRLDERAPLKELNVSSVYLES